MLKKGLRVMARWLQANLGHIMTCSLHTVLCLAVPNMHDRKVDSCGTAV